MLNCSFFKMAAAAAAANAAATTNSSNATAASAAAAVPAASASAVRMVPVQITVPAQPGSGHPTPKSITVQVPAHALQGGAAGAQLQTVLSSPTVTAALSLPVEMAQTLLQQHINQALQVSVINKSIATLYSLLANEFSSSKSKQTPSTARSQVASTVTNLLSCMSSIENFIDFFLFISFRRAELLETARPVEWHR
jgi:hypothetical protein